MPTITTAGEQLLAAVASGQKPITTTDDNGQPVVGDQIILAMVSGLDTSATPPKTEMVPTASIVDTVPVNRAGLASESTAVFSGVIDSTRGDYSFNWIGLHNSEHDVLLAVAYEPAQAKYATAGVQIGNVLTKNFALTITSAAAVTGLTASIASWQFDYLQRFTSAEQLNQTTTAATFGGACFESPAGAISGYNVQTGNAIINGLLVTVPSTDLTALQSEPAGNHPFYVYATVSQQATINGVANLCSIETSQTTLASFDSNGTHHHRELIATITAQNAITDNRASVHTALIPAPVKTAIDSANTAAETATNAVTAITAAAAAAQSTADTAATAATAAQSTADTAATAATAAQSTADNRMLGDNNLNEISNQKTSRENIGIFQIVVESDGTVRNGPTGWTANKIGTGKYQVFPSPQLGTSINVMANRVGPDIGYAGENPDNRAANFFEIRTGTNSASTNNWVAEDGQFIATVYKI